MYSEQCKSCIVEGCPDSCHVKQAYKRDLVEVVRCKDCKHRDPEDKRCDCGHDIMWQLPRNDNWFCADAERRSDD